MNTQGALDSHFSVVVLGAGPSGAAAAGESARHGLRTALVQRGGAHPVNIGECVPPGIRPELEKAGVWEEFLRAGHTPSAGIRSIWGAPEPSEREFFFSPYGVGWHIDRARFDDMLRRSALHCGAQMIHCQTLRAVERTSGGWQLHLTTEAGESQVTASLVIDATGRSSVFARRAGVKRLLLDSLTGVAGYFSLQQDAGGIEPVLVVEAAENGWWYTAPLPGGRLIAVFLTDAEYIQKAALTQRDRWLSVLQSTVQQSLRIRAHGAVLDGAIRILPAESSLLEQTAADHWLASGDAAAAFDPLSSQGILSAVSGGMEAGRTASAWLAGDEGAPAAYMASTRRKYAEYLVHRELYYRIEERWPASSFWQSRQTAPAALAAHRKGVSA